MTPLLAVEGLTAGYGKAEVLHGVSLSVAARQIVAIVGPNGAGKTTLMHAVMGLMPRGGRVTLGGADAGDAGWLVSHGVVLVPETRALFTDMSVEDNLELGAFARWRQGARDLAPAMADVFSIFPRLQERRRQAAGTLSGGERQMLALGRALMGQPRLLLLDEPSLGLAPLIVRDIFRVIEALRDRGIAILLVEQLIEKALKLADRVYALARGSIVLEARTNEDDLPNRLEHAYFGQDVSAPLAS